jgi:hypothetical protein
VWNSRAAATSTRAIDLMKSGIRADGQAMSPLRG